jgi:hypothetical protein
VTISVRANIPAFHAGSDKKPATPSSPEDRKKIIAEINADSEHAIDRLNQRDPGADTRARQQRIIENIDKLLNEQDPDPKGNSQRPPPPKPMNPPPKPSGSDPGQKPMQAKEQGPQSPMPPTAKPAGNSKSGQIPKSSDNPNTQKELGPWPYGRPGNRQEMDSIPRDGLIRNYEELLRAYYRNIADSSRKGAD